MNIGFKRKMVISWIASSIFLTMTFTVTSAFWIVKSGYGLWNVVSMLVVIANAYNIINVFAHYKSLNSNSLALEFDGDGMTINAPFSLNMKVKWADIVDVKYHSSSRVPYKIYVRNAKTYLNELNGMIRIYFTITDILRGTPFIINMYTIDGEAYELTDIISRYKQINDNDFYSDDINIR